ncbi:MAG: hypothetical protein GTN38_03675 [Candidatus Aenigmarchaeota archaeon]|nr:hypothetical protein [Candidatus Aenigmarchaeota archaeon]NIP40761.1 hypothetical protein [Candidatus Aenigmarchaeota archaeon]NIQ18567.1 hypothetical protein [Candidatus Aenigmarchaeota archaeon]NIS73466.1 hypothetical protein [Candidatus Aenigmarchaeota archaeon]
MEREYPIIFEPDPKEKFFGKLCKYLRVKRKAARMPDFPEETVERLNTELERQDGDDPKQGGYILHC